MLRHARADYFARDEKRDVYSFLRGGMKEFIADPDALEDERGKAPIIYKHIFGKCPPGELPYDNALVTLGSEMKRLSQATAAPDESCIPAGYTYLGQFIFHDITAMLPSKKAIAGGHWKSARTPALDLDSVLDGVKPEDDPAVETDGGLFAIGQTTGNVKVPEDLRRIPEAASEEEDRGRPYITDPRNDDFLPLAQCHLLLLKFYNALARHRGYDGRHRDRAWWEETRRAWVRHFQWIVLYDYLPRMIDGDIYRDVLDNGRLIVRPTAAAHDSEWFPIEVAGAIGRFGHSMIRDSYRPWNPRKPGEPFGVDQFMEFSWLNSRDSLKAHEFGLPGIWKTNWYKLFDLRQSGEAGQHFDPFMANAIDIRLASRLFDLPHRILETRFPPQTELPDDETRPKVDLATTTLLRGRELELASAQTTLGFAEEMIGRPVPVLRETEFFPAGMQLGAHGDSLIAATPLWYYTLREAECLGRGRRLGPLAGRIIMETMHASIAASPDSIFDAPGWHPVTHDGAFSMRDLISFCTT